MSSGFITDTEIAEARKKRQDEWEKVRSADQPIERPEEPYDGRSLFDRLQEQKMKKNLEYEEAHKLKNLIKGLDDDEVQFLELVDKSKLESEKQQLLEEQQELAEFRFRVSALQDEAQDKKIQSEFATKKLKSKPSSGTSVPVSQKKLIGLCIKRKISDSESSGTSSCKMVQTKKEEDNDAVKKVVPALNMLDNIKTEEFNKGALKCVGILPGMGSYNESSDSEMSSGSDEEPYGGVIGKYDLCGRKRECKKKHSH